MRGQVQGNRTLEREWRRGALSKADETRLQSRPPAWPHTLEPAARKSMVQSRQAPANRGNRGTNLDSAGQKIGGVLIIYCSGAKYKDAKDKTYKRMV